MNNHMPKVPAVCRKRMMHRRNFHEVGTSRTDADNGFHRERVAGKVIFCTKKRKANRPGLFCGVRRIIMYSARIENSCIICGQASKKRLLYPSNYREEDLNVDVFSARRMPDRLHGNVVRCETCGLIFADPLVDPARLAHLYLVSKYTYSEEESFIQKTYERYVAKAAAQLNPATKSWSFLDIGCGNGFMLQSAKKLGFESVHGVEPSSHAIEQADPSIRAGIIQGMFSGELVGENMYDLITCFQTLDHITEPDAFVRECLKALKPGGKVLFINHNIGSIPARLLGERCPMIDIEHTYLHTKKTMQMLFEKEGYTNIQVFGVRNDYPLHYWTYMLPLPKGLKKRAISILNRKPLNTILIPLYAGNLGLIATKPLQK